MQRVIDWDKIRNEYITTATSYSRLAAKYHISRGFVSKRAAEEHWTELKRKYSADFSAKLQAAAQEEGINALRKAGDIARAALAKIEELLPVTPNGKQMDALIGALGKAAALIRDIYRLPTYAEEASMSNAAERLALDKRKTDIAETDKNGSDITITINGAEDMAE